MVQDKDMAAYAMIHVEEAVAVKMPAPGGTFHTAHVIHDVDG